MALNILAYLLMLPAVLFFFVAVVSWPVEPENRTMVKELAGELWLMIKRTARQAWDDKGVIAKFAIVWMFTVGLFILWFKFLAATHV